MNPHGKKTAVLIPFRKTMDPGSTRPGDAVETEGDIVNVARNETGAARTVHDDLDPESDYAFDKGVAEISSIDHDVLRISDALYSKTA